MLAQMRSNVSGSASARAIKPLAVIPEQGDELSSRESKRNDTELSSDAGFSSDGNESPMAKRNNELEVHGFDFSRPMHVEHSNPIINVMNTSS